MRIAYRNLVDGVIASSLTCLSENSLFPIGNIQEQRLSVAYQSLTPTSQTITINLGSAQSIDTAAILGHNLSTSATIVVAANTSNSWTPAATSQTLVWNTGAILKFFTSQSYQWYQFQISNASNPSAYISLGRIWLGEYVDISPSSLESFTVSVKRSDNVFHGRNRQKFASPGISWRNFKMDFPVTEEAMIVKLSAMYEYAGNHSSMIFCNFDTMRNYSLVEPCYVSMVNQLDFAHQNRMRFTYSLELEEEK